MYQELYEKAKAIIKDIVCMKVYNEKEPQNLERDKSGVEPGAGLLWARDGLWVTQDEAADNTMLHPIAFCR